MIEVSQYSTTQSKFMPVCLLLDTSRSMCHGHKIETLNNSVRKMLETFAEHKADFRVAMISFATEAEVHCEFKPAQKVLEQWRDLRAGGVTRLTLGLQKTKELLENKDKLSGRRFRPIIILVSDGGPTDETGRANDDWIEPMQDLIHNGRSSKCDRWAMAIGENAKHHPLEQFISGCTEEDGSPRQLRFAENSKEIVQFFTFITDIATSRTQNPLQPSPAHNLPESIQPGFDDDELDETEEDTGFY